MATSKYPKDLVVLVSDKDMLETFKALLKRHQSLGIRPVNFDVFSHPGHDGACHASGDRFLSDFIQQYRYAILAFDFEGSNTKLHSREDVEKALERRMSADWKDKCCAVVIEPELENWIWSGSPGVLNVMKWTNTLIDVRTYLSENGFCIGSDNKPERPKEAFRFILSKSKSKSDSSLFRQLAQTVSFKRCTDPSFTKLKNTLQKWFPIENN